MREGLGVRNDIGKWGGGGRRNQGGLRSSNVKNERISFWKRNQKRFGIVPKFVFFENRLFSIGPESALLDSGANSDVLVSFLLDVGTIVERLLL